GYFKAENAEKVTLNVIGLGFFKCYINGKCINKDTFLPLSSDYEAAGEPEGEVLSGHRIYVPQFDITPYVKEGDNIIALVYGGGWYTCRWRRYGFSKAIYCITVQTGNKEEYFVSDESCKIGESFVEAYDFTTMEAHNYTAWEDCCISDFDDSNWENAVETEAINTEYCTTDCPGEKCVEMLTLQEIGRSEKGIIYDCGRNTVGYPVVRLNALKGEKVTVTFSESITAEGNLDPVHTHGQQFSVVSDGKLRSVQPEFTWFGFRYMEVVGDAVPLFVKEVYADVLVSSAFECDIEVLNWFYKTFIHTMLTNMHTGLPSDCPHLERRGYTGDGQLTCNAVLTIFDAQAFYEKWMQDIADCQDSISGRVQNTAPYIASGGGPGGWGSAIVEVPYQLYLHYGNTKVLEDNFDGMLKYIRFLESRTEQGFITNDKESSWCLGEWCPPCIMWPGKDLHSAHKPVQMIIPPAYINNYYMIKAMEKICRIAEITGKTELVKEYPAKIEQLKQLLQAAYFNTFDHSFFMNAQGANAFALDVGIGTEKTYEALKKYYKNIGFYDTGIFATDVLTRVLFEKGDAELAVDLLTGSGEYGYAKWMENGATTLHEYWDSNSSRSHNHPMFGAPAAYLFEYLLGIKQKEFTGGYKSVIIAPQAVSKFGRMSGSITTPQGVIAVSYKKQDGKVLFSVTIPENTQAVFCFDNTEAVLKKGENSLEFAIDGE
ncbi:MAG: family 78 glycoside hydrolase catalytic domain, partial [Oscillospiraceae bacterium]|nr:family 78 glycoside hydrolase catalytic domain [Oscillospiraceae bacterium]